MSDSGREQRVYGDEVLPVLIDYTNWKGERRKRRVKPYALVFTESGFHPGGAQWILLAFDLEDGGKRKDFAMTGVHGWEPSPELKPQESRP